MSRQSDTIKTGKNWFDNAELSSSKHDEILIWLHGKIKDNFIAQILNKERFEYVKLTSIEIEKPIFGVGRQYDVKKGFADLFARVEVIDKSLAGKEIKQDWPRPPTIDDGKCHLDFYFEIKSKVNIGETIRQVKYYGGDNWFVCAPDFPHKDLLLENNIGFVPYGN